MIRLRQANKLDIHRLMTGHFNGNPVRQKDVDEWVTLGGNTPWVCLGARDHGWTDARVALDDADNVLVMFGVYPSPADPEIGFGWLVGTEAGVKEARHLHRFHRKFLKEMESKYRHVVAATIWPEDDAWHKALGFEFATLTDNGFAPIMIYVRSSQWAS